MADVTALLVDRQVRLETGEGLLDEASVARRLAAAGLNDDQFAALFEAFGERFGNSHGLEEVSRGEIRIIPAIRVEKDPLANAPANGITRDQLSTWVEVIDTPDGYLMVPNDSGEEPYIGWFVARRVPDEQSTILIPQRATVDVATRRFIDVDSDNGLCTLRIFDDGDLDCFDRDLCQGDGCGGVYIADEHDDSRHYKCGC